MLYHELEDDVPEQGEYNIGYFEGRQQKKKWLVTLADLEAMYSYYEGKAHISLWCDGRNQSDHEVSSDDMKEKGHQNEQGRKRIYHSQRRMNEKMNWRVFIKSCVRNTETVVQAHN